MNISIFGLGYVGCVGVGCLAELGHNVIGVDINESKVNLINQGKATIIEKDIDEIIRKNRIEGRIRATLDVKDAVDNSDVAIICVGTPNDDNGHLNMKHIEDVTRQIAESIKDKNSFFTIAIRSTVMPGTNEKVSKIIETVSGRKNNIDFGVVSNPEFLREGSAVKDFFDPPYTVLASSSKKALEQMKAVYEKIDAEFIITDIGTAELIKLVNNSFHALKVAFGNEIGRICKNLGIDVFSVMDLFTRDTMLNISPYYFKPGFAYGGSCLPKDLKALNTIAHDKYVRTPILSSVEISNKYHIDFAYDLIVKKGKKKIGFVGISFKPGTDDLRYSPVLELVERLLGKGYEISIYDENINLSSLLGKNKEFLFSKLPHINKILQISPHVFVENSELFIISHNIEKIKRLLFKRKDVHIIELNRVFETNMKENCEGISW